MRSRRALLVAVAVGAALSALCPSAFGYFSTKGSGTVSTPVGELVAPTITAATATTGAVALTWSAAKAPSGTIAYYVTRNGGAPGGNCPSAAAPENAITSCTDQGLEAGTYTYVVTAVWRSWKAASGSSQAKVTLGAGTHLVITVASTTPAAGVADSLTITAKSASGATATAYTGSHTLVFSGAEPSPGGSEPTVASSEGTATPFGEPTNLTFTAGIAKVSGSKNGVMKVFDAGPASISAGDGSIESEANPTVTVAPGAVSKLALSAATVEPVAGQADALTTTALDSFGNTATTFTGAKSLSFSGASNGPSGEKPTVTDSSGKAQAFGSVTSATFSAGVATASGTKNGVATFYKAGAASIKVTEGKVTSAALVITTRPGEPKQFTVAASSAKPAAGATDNLKTTAFDAFGNTATNYEGTHAIVFSGAEPSPSGIAPTVVDSEGDAIEFGEPVALEFSSGVASVGSGANGVMTLPRAGATTIQATDHQTEATGEVAVTVATGSAANLGWAEPKVSAGTLSAPCLFTCTIAKLGNSGTFIAAVEVTDTLGNVVENVGSGHTVKVTASGGTVTGGTLTIATKGVAKSETTFTYKAPTSGTFTNTITAAKSTGTAYTSATAIATR
jgi:hypothetical protein